MTRALFVAVALTCGSVYVTAQQASVLHIKVLLLDATGKPMPVPNHALLISEEPPSAPPRRVVVGVDGTIDVSLRPGDYAIESDRPVAFRGRAYEWAQRITMFAGRDVSLELNAQNAEGTAAPTSRDLESDPVFLLNRWDRSVVGIWTPLAHGAGIIVDAANGLVATNARLAASASEIQVQLTPEITVRARIVGADSDRDIAILQIHPSLTALIPALVPDCAASADTALARGQDLVAIAAPLRGPKNLASGSVVSVDGQATVADLRLPAVSAGGPVFADGRLAGITSMTTSDVDDTGSRWASRVVGVDALCAGLASAQKTMREGAVPDATHLPADPALSFPADALKAIVARRAGGLSPPQMSFADFDVAFITPVHTFGAQPSPQAATRQRVGLGLVDVGSPELRPVRAFANWSDYVAEYLPVLLVRVTPKLAEGFWTSVARGAAYTQGVPLPSMKRVKTGFARMRAFCGDREVTPIHPFKLEQRVSESDVIEEGLYAFDADALGAQCPTVTLTVYSDRKADKGETRQITPSIIQSLSRDFAAYRQATAPPAP